MGRDGRGQHRVKRTRVRVGVVYSMHGLGRVFPPPRGAWSAEDEEMVPWQSAPSGSPEQQRVELPKVLS